MRVVFSIFIDLGDNLFGQYFDKLLKNKEDYCKKIDVDFRLYTDLPKNFVDLNHTKHFIMRDLANEYDEILYVDFDTVFNTEENIFEKFDLSKGIACEQYKDEAWFFSNDGKTDRSIHVKKMIGSVYGYDIKVYNTGVILATSEQIKQLNYVETYNELKDKEVEVEENWKDTFTLNNEAVFGICLKKNKIKVQPLKQWHDMRFLSPTDKKFGKIVHFINKCFWTFFKDKKSVIYSLYIDIDDEKLDKAGNYNDDTIDKSLRTKLAMNEYRERLLENHKNYAKSIGVNYIHFGYDIEYESFKQDLQTKYPRISDYNVVNFYKIYLIDKLSKQYDFVLYIDFDVVIDTKISFFDSCDLEKSIHVIYDSVKERAKQAVHDPRQKEINYRDPVAKYWNCYAMLNEIGEEGENFVFNTGVIGASKTTMNRLAYFEDFDKTIALMDLLKDDEDSMFVDKVKNSFGYDNETVFSFKVKTNNVAVQQIGTPAHPWHARVDHTIEKKKDLPKQFFLHFMNKKFNWYFD